MISGFLVIYLGKTTLTDFINDKLVDSETVGQFTGLHDIDNKEIQEGDIVEFGYKSYL